MLTPETILQGRYRIVRQLGQGGMGAVYEAVDQRLDTTVALKETLFADERLRKQFEREARLLARLHHPALPRVSDHFSEEDGQFLVMQFIPGDDLMEKITRKRGPFPADQVLTWADQLLDALDYLHTQDPQIVHRDIKPQNMKLTARGQIILLDFGLAKGQAGDISRATTAASIFGYTPNYAPLEQIQGLGTDARSDLYSLGATLYHLMTGIKPPDALTRAAAVVNGQPDPLVPASSANPAVSPVVDTFLAKAMAQNREQRYATATEMRRDLHSSSEAATVVNRGEAQTMLFPPGGASTVAIPTETIVRQETIRAGDTTVVRPLAAGQRRVLPWVISIGALMLLGCGVLAFFQFGHRSDSVVQVTLTPTPSPAASATATPTPEDDQADADATAEPTEEAKKTDAPVAKKPSTRAEEPKARTSSPDPARVDPDVPSHEDPNVDVQVPDPPDAPGMRPRRPQTQTFPGGVTIRTFPDGSQVITTPDGMRVYKSPDGKRKVLNPARRPARRPGPAPTPSP